MDLIERLKLFCAEKNLAFIEDVAEIEAKMTSIAVSSSSVQTKLESYFKHQMAAYKKADFETAFLKATKFTKGSRFNLAL